MKLGTCYYPEHWPPELWASDAQRMAEAGLSLVRIDYFAREKILKPSGLGGGGCVSLSYGFPLGGFGSC